MRISDWSSDVCSSDLGAVHPSAHREHDGPAFAADADHAQYGYADNGRRGFCLDRRICDGLALDRAAPDAVPWSAGWRGRKAGAHAAAIFALGGSGACRRQDRRIWGLHRTWRLFIRSEEHTSELLSLMRISYAVF